MTVMLSDADRGTAVTVEVGERVEIQVGENPATGYRWQLAPPPGIEVVDDEYELAPPATIGSGGTRRFTVMVASAGSYELRLRLARPWEDQAGAIEDVRFKVDAVQPREDRAGEGRR